MVKITTNPTLWLNFSLSEIWDMTETTEIFISHRKSRYRKYSARREARSLRRRPGPLQSEGGYRGRWRRCWHSWRCCYWRCGRRWLGTCPPPIPPSPCSPGSGSSARGRTWRAVGGQSLGGSTHRDRAGLEQEQLNFLSASHSFLSYLMTFLLKTFWLFPVLFSVVCSKKRFNFYSH